MQLAFLDANFTVIKYTDFINLQWIRRYYEPGEFSLQIPASEYDNAAVYLFTKDRPELGIIQKREFADGYDGATLQLSGYFYEYRLNDKITMPAFFNSGNIEDLAREIVETYRDDMPIITLGEANTPRLGDSTSKQSKGEGLATAIFGLLQTQELSCRCRYDYTANKMFFEIWRGKDRTQDQDENSFVTFSEAFRNIQNEKITIDSSAFKNYAVVLFKNEKDVDTTVEIDARSGGTGYKNILFINQSADKYDATKQTWGAYVASMRQKGAEALAQRADITNISFETIDGGLRYREDYDLGDRCDVVIDTIGASYTVRIIEIDEVFKEGRHTITLQFGDKIPTIYSKVRRS